MPWGFRGVPVACAKAARVCRASANFIGLNCQMRSHGAKPAPSLMATVPWDVADADVPGTNIRTWSSGWWMLGSLKLFQSVDFQPQTNRWKMVKVSTIIIHNSIYNFPTSLEFHHPTPRTWSCAPSSSAPYPGTVPCLRSRGCPWWRPAGAAAQRRSSRWPRAPSTPGAARWRDPGNGPRAPRQGPWCRWWHPPVGWEEDFIHCSMSVFASRRLGWGGGVKEIGWNSMKQLYEDMKSTWKCNNSMYWFVHVRIPHMTTSLSHA